MNRWLHAPRAYVLVLALTLVLRVATALPLQQAGYMDASYAMHVAENLATGRGLVENVLWNYLDRPAGLPHPSNLYWMPLPSLLIAPFFALLGATYRVAQIPFLLLSLPLPLFAFYLSRRVFGRDDYAWASALFTAFSGFYMVYWVSPDNFTPFALTASLCIYVMARGIETQSVKYWVAAGMLAALSHLSRADGLLLLAIPPVAMALYWRRVGFSNLRSTAVVVAAYLLVMAPWFLRNYITVGTLYPSAGTKTLWLTSYDELFRYADDLTAGRYLAWGMGSILGSKFYAAMLNLLVVSFGDLQLYLVPFALVGLWQLRRRIEFLPFFVYVALLFPVMTLVFTFPSWRGSMLHSSIALLPFLAVAVPPGVDAAVRWVAHRRRTWKMEQASRFFQWGFVCLAIVFSLILYGQGIFGSLFGDAGTTPLWNVRDSELAAVSQWLDRNARPEDIVMDVDPPSFYNISHRRAIMVPTDGLTAVFDAARQYGATYLVLRFDHPRPLNGLYAGKENVAGLTGVADFRDALGRPVRLLRIGQ